MLELKRIKKLIIMIHYNYTASSSSYAGITEIGGTIRRQLASRRALLQGVHVWHVPLGIPLSHLASNMRPVGEVFEKALGRHVAAGLVLLQPAPVQQQAVHRRLQGRDGRRQHANGQFKAPEQVLHHVHGGPQLAYWHVPHDEEQACECDASCGQSSSHQAADQHLLVQRPGEAVNEGDGQQRESQVGCYCEGCIVGWNKLIGCDEEEVEGRSSPL